MPIRKQQLNRRSGLFAVRQAGLLLVILAGGLAAQQGGFIRGDVHERSGVAVPGAEIRIVSELTGAQQKAYCDKHGLYVSNELAAGVYRLTAKAHGFHTVTQPEVLVQPGRTTAVNFVVDLFPLEQEVTVKSTRGDADPTANGLDISRNSPANTLPANGRDLHALYGIMPGAIVTPASSEDGGQLTVGGQRPNTNSFRIDGINGNTGIGVSALPGTFPGSSLPGMTAIGSTQDLAAKDDIERVDLRSFDFAPGYGSRPGAQIIIETRSGSNKFHGSAFGYLRPRLFDSSDWFANQYHTGVPAASLHGYGGSLGGPLLGNRTSFFLAFEQEHVNDTATQLMAMPSLKARKSAATPYNLMLNAFPLPSGPPLNANESLAPTALQKQASVTNYSARIDRTFGDKLHLFVRYANVPSHSVTEQLESTNAGFRWDSTTVGATLQLGRAIHDFRLNFTRALNTSSSAALTAPEQAAFLSFRNPLASSNFFSFAPEITALSIAGVGQLVSGISEHTTQNQWEGRYTISKQIGTHGLQAGGDYFQLLPRTTTGDFSTVDSIVSEGTGSLLAGDPLEVTISGRVAIQSGHIPVASLFAQDTFHVNDRMTLLYGLRWDFTTNSNATVGTAALSTFGTWNGPFTALQPAANTFGVNEFNWPTSYTQFAPRFGLAYRLKAQDLIVRAGAGLFYDTDLGSLIDPINAFPFNVWQFSPGKDSGIVSPLPSHSFTVPALSLPRVWEWRTSLEKSIEDSSTLSLSYLGSAGRKLLRNEGTVNPQTSVLNQSAFTSYGESDYEALQMQFTGSIRPNLYMLIAYTWGHSIDNGSQNSSIFLTKPGFNRNADRGSSDFDIRHNFTASLNYRLSAENAHGFRRTAFSNWNVSTTLQARAGFPFDVTTADRSIGLGFANSGRPELVTDVPVWINHELNAAAFRPTSNGINGTLGRNVLTGPGLFQIDAGLRRQFRLFRGAALETSLSAFNLFNHTNFANPESYLASPLFGRSISLQNLMLGSGTPTTGLTPVFQSGGPRTVEFNLKFSF